MMPRNSMPLIEREIVCTYKIKLEKVLGVTVSSNSALHSSPNGDLIAYPAGCTVVLFNTQTGEQNHIVNTNRKSITSLAFSSCGRYLVTGEFGHQPAVRVWDLQSDPQSTQPGLFPQPQQIAEFQSHKYGICCVAFSPSNKFVVSIGTQHDMIVNVWDWRNNVKVASNKVSMKVKALAFAENGSYFVTVGNRHVKFWFLEYGKAKYTEAVPLMGRSAILGVQRNNYFCDVACGRGQCGDSTYAVTRSGLLCEFNNRRLLDKWVELRTTSANCIVIGEKYIFVGCAEGIVRCFDPITLHFVTTLPRTHYLGVDVSSGLAIQHMSSPPSEAKYPDTIAATYDETNNKLTCIYNDHSIYIWDVHNIRRVGKSHSFLFHSACIWGVEMAPPSGGALPPGSFLSCSSDDTIRLWTLDKLTQNTSRGIYQGNIYSDELLKSVYIDDELTFLKDTDLSQTNVSTPADKTETNTSYDSRNGVRCVKLSPDGKHLASGDRAGNIHIHETGNMKEILKIEAHDAEVLCLEYSSSEYSDHKLLVSASRDRLIHVFDVSNNYAFLQTLDDHSSSITAVRLLNSPDGSLQMVSCGADKCLIFRSLGGTPNGSAQFTRGNNATGKATLYDMEVDSGQKHVITACQDRNVRVYSVATGKHTKSFKGSTGDEGTLIKVALDRSGIYLATSCTDKSLSVYDYYTGECMATMCGHSELATGLRFTNDCKRLISASGDGCIFVWKVPHDMVVTMHARLSQQAMRQGKALDSDIFSDGGQSSELYESGIDNYRFSVGQLPQWARKRIPEVTSTPASPYKVAPPKGRWAQRAEENILTFYSANSVISFSSIGDRRVDSDGSKDSSLDSGTESRQYRDDFKQTPQTNITSNSPSSRLPSSERTRILTDDSALGSLGRDPDTESTAHDADIDSDHEYNRHQRHHHHQPLYYPSQIDSASGSEFTVTNIDADELRKSVRKSKRNFPLIPLAVQQPTSISGSQESDDDDDEASTPSGENTDRNPMSFLSVSSESLDQLSNREKYLQSTFESLSGVETMEASTPGLNKSSISSQYHTRLGATTTQLRNINVINATRQAKNDPDTLKKREELSKMIADTKKKLANVGHNSPLKYSKSIHDLSHIPERDKWGSPNGSLSRGDIQSPKSVVDNSLRRSCSLSDLSMQTPPAPIQPKRKIDKVSGKHQKSTSVSSSRMTVHGAGGGTQSISNGRGYNKTLNMVSMMKSSSTSALNQPQSDSEPEIIAEKKISSRLMRPTISSLNKLANKSTNNTLHRKRHAHSVMNLSTVGNGDTSSEDEAAKIVQKPVVPPRTRNLSELRKNSSGKDSGKNLRKKSVEIQDDLETTLIGIDVESPEKLDVSTAQLSKQLCDKVAESLTIAANNVEELYRRLWVDSSSEEPQRNVKKSDMVKNLELSIARMQNVLQDVALKRIQLNVTTNGCGETVNQTEKIIALKELFSKGVMNDQDAFVKVMQQYSDILLTMMHQKIQSD
ncbi:WD repeat-containing protein 62 isoform X2 [Onthophagus taurus]|uniref:WD repeat-containing protein 62 isoform X2 n=1 Tax=Onthophagus taurus TaxID=166361 RepID=UPI0039BE1123